MAHPSSINNFPPKCSPLCKKRHAEWLCHSYQTKSEGLFRLKKPPSIVDMNGNDTYLDVNNAHLRVTSGNIHASGFNIDQISIVTTSNTGSTINFLNDTKGFTSRSNIEVGTANLFVDTTTSNVGVGTNEPAYTLDVHGSANVGTITAIAFVGDGSGLTGISTSPTLQSVTDTGNVTSNTIQFTNVTTGLVATGNVEASKFIGDGSLLTGVSGGGSSNLHQVVENGNVTSNTIQFTNATTGLVTTGNVSIGKELSVTGNVAVDTDTLFVDSVNDRVGVGKTNPATALDVDGTVTATTFAGSGSGLTALPAAGELVSYTSDPASANAGAVYFNTTDNVVRFYNGSVWWSVAPIPPSITNISPTTFGGQIGELFTITGAEFDVNTTVIFKGADSTEYASAVVTFISSAQITATNATTLPVSNEPYKIKVTSATGTITSFQTIDSGTLPTFTTASGQLSSNAWNVPVSTAVLASDTETSIASYSIVTGVLPTGLSINTSTGAITGTPIEQNSTTYTFTVQALDTAGNATTRQFNIQIINGTPVWSVPAAAESITIYINEAATGSNAVTLTATDPEGSAVVYSTSNTLPTGLNLVGNTITGTPTVIGSYPLTINASDGYTSAPRNFTLLVGRPVHSSKGLTGAQSFTLRTRSVAKDMVTTSDTTTIPSGANPKNPAGSMAGSTLPTGTPHRWSDWSNDIFDNWGRWYIYDTSTGSASYIQFGTLNGPDETVYTETQTHHSKTFTIIHGWVVEGIFKLDVECSDDTFQFSIGMYGNMGADGGNNNSDHQYTASWGKLSYNFNRDAATSDPFFTHFIPKQVTFNAGITLSGTNFTTNLNTGTVGTSDYLYVWSDPLEIGAIMYFVKALPASSHPSLTIEERSMAEWVANDIT